ncbi:MAG: hypothetical protein ACTSXD_10270 [Candidatus Heimdallarchaeaceae archaeon]
MTNNQKQINNFIDSQKIYWIILIFLVVLLSALIVFYFFFKKGEISEIRSTKEKTISSVFSTPPVVVHKINKNTLPDDIPSDIPLEKDALILENKIISLPDQPGTIQYTRKFISKKTLEENYKIYRNFIDRNDWDLISSVKKKYLISLSAMKSKNKQLLITISKNTIAGTVIVDITVVSR